MAVNEIKRMAKCDAWDLIPLTEICGWAGLTEEGVLHNLLANDCGFAEITEDEFALTPRRMEQLREIINREIDNILYKDET